MPALNKLYDDYQQQVTFLVVYILEAHPTDVWQMESNVQDKVLFATPTNLEERSQIAGACVRKLGIKIPAVVDGIDNTVEHAYTGWPDRMYLIDGSGRIAYKSKPGPFGFTTAELRAALERVVPKQRASR